MPPRPSEGLGRQPGHGSCCAGPWPQASWRSWCERETGTRTLESPEPGASCACSALAPSGRPSPRAGWVAEQAPTGPCPSLHSQPRGRPGHEVLRPDLPQQHRDLRRPGPLCLLLPGQPVQQQRGHGPAGRPRRPVGHRQPAVDSALGGLLSPVSPEPSQPAWGPSSALVSPSLLPAFPRPHQPPPKSSSPAAGNPQHGHTLTRPSPGFQGSPSHPAVGRAPGFSPAPSSPLEGLPLQSPSPSGRASRAPCALRRPPLQLFLCRRGRPESRALQAPLQPLLPHEDSCSPARLSAGAPTPHRPRGRPRGQWACLLGLSRWGSGC